ncbi:MAG: ABC transporter substrate-binding protein [Proteobacteria bacterium]|nr:ABC transporter substrate-binding protein [Pseudomonadota bacterium]
MIFRIAIAIALLVYSLSAAQADERVTVATMRNVANGALFVAAARGYFKAEGITLDMTAYPSDADVVKAMASGSAEIGLANWSADTVKLASQGIFKAVAGQIREKNGFEGNEIVISTAAYGRGLRKFDQVGNGIVVVDQVGTSLHYQLVQASRTKGDKAEDFTLKFAGSPSAAARAVAENHADVAVLPMLEARNLLATNQAKLMAWCSQIAEPELGAVFAAAKMLGDRRTVTEKFLRAYRRGAADFFNAFLRLDKYSKRISNKESQQAAKILAFYIHPHAARDEAAAILEGEILYIDPQARLDTADIGARIAWYQAQGLVDKAVTAQNIVDLNFR